ncbi:hypothetical protein GCWU000246_01125 [Jonquetella anthropi E3_33 E1]|nr:hypothetical protein GCWU000246_01125 [Jonquetella anthropi E3_33 E1]
MKLFSYNLAKNMKNVHAFYAFCLINSKSKIKRLSAATNSAD